MSREFYVYLKTQNHSSGDGVSTNVIPLRVNNVSFDVSKTIPSFPIPLSGLTTGESSTIALDLGMSSKSVSLQGFIVGGDITKTIGTTNTTLTFTAHEIAQMIASGVDSTGFARNQAFSELVILMPSTVSSSYTQRASIDVPFTFHSRGNALEKENEGVLLPIGSFPDSTNAKGLTGFVRQFGFEFSGEMIEISFNMSFEIATIIP